MRALVLTAVAIHALAALLLLPLRWIYPWTTAVQAQRRVESLWSRKAYTKRYSPVPLARISPHLQHAVLAAEDGRFYQHWGIDWKELGKVAEHGLEDGKLSRGASTITQQLVKNLFFTTHRNPLRKAAEFTLAPMAELILQKQRILDLYLNVIEWGPGVWGAEAASQSYYGTSAAGLSRDAAARMAAVIPAPSRRRPAAMHRYGDEILGRMSRMGW